MSLHTWLQYALVSTGNDLTGVQSSCPPGQVDESGANWHHNLHVQLAISQRPCTHDSAISTEDNAHKVGTLPIRLHTGTSCKMIHLSTVCKESHEGQ